MNYTSINNIISKCYSDLGDGATDANHKRYYQWILRYYGQLCIHKLPLDVVETLPVQTGVRCIIIPKKYVGFVAIGKIINNQLVKFSLKADLVPQTTEECGTETQTDVAPMYPGHTGYATGGGRNLWYYRPDEGNNRILIYGSPLTEATLVYKSTGVDANGEVFIPTIAEESLIANVHYQEALNGGDKGMIGIRKQVLDSALNDLQMIEWNSDAMFDEIYSTIYQGVKR